MKSIKKIIVGASFLLFTICLTAQTPPHPNGGSNPGSGNTPVGGGAPMDGGIGLLMLMGAAYAVKKTNFFRRAG